MTYQSTRTPTLLLLEKDDETRRLLIETLRDRGYRVLAAIDEENAIEWLRNNEREHPDVLLINQVGLSRENYLEMIGRIYQQSRLSSKIPSVIIAEKYQAILEGTEEKIDDNKYIIYLENAQQLFDLLYRLCFSD